MARTKEKAKTTISLAPELLAFADRRAVSRRTTRSQVIADLLAEAAAREEELMVEGYRFYSAESAEFAEMAAPLFWDVVKNER